jgi:ankyrin repeat protein
MKKVLLISFFILADIFIFVNSTLAPFYAHASQQSPPAIYQAIISNKPDRAKAAIDMGEDVNAVYERDTLLCIAISEGKLEIAKLIIQSSKADVNKRGACDDGFHNIWERTPLILAAQMGYTEIVDLLLKKGAVINARDRINGSPLSRGNSALIQAARNNHLDVVRLLVAQARKPDVKLQNTNGKTAFWFAVENENLEMVKFLYSNGSKINLPDNSGSSVLTTTVLHKKYDVLDFLVSKGADINMVNNIGETPLMTAITLKNKDRQVVLNYLEKFLTFNPKLGFETIKNNNGGYSALHLATRWGFVEAIKLLVDKGADINVVSLATGGTPLHTAASSKNYEAAKYLIQRGAKLEIRDAGGATPLIAAVMMADPEMAQVLVESGAVIDTRSSVNVLVTPLVFAAANIDPFKHKDYLTIINYLLDQGADSNFQAANGLTALMAAAGSSEHGRAFEKATLLIKRGAKLNMVNDKGETALMLAAGAGNDKVVKLLIDKGANINLKNGAGESAMSYANLSGQKTIISLLESKGAKPDGPSVMKPVIIDALIGTWKGYQDGMPQIVYNIVFRKDSTFDFNTQFTPEALKRYPAGSVNPVIAVQKGTYTFNNDIMIWNPVGTAPVSMRWKLENKTLIIDKKIRLKKIK